MKHKVREWLKRYLPAEVISVAATVLSALIAYELSGNRIATALISTWAGNIGYFGYIILFDVFETRRTLHSQDRPYTSAIFYKNIKALAVEFGIAEVLDSLLIRPALMYYVPIWMNNMALGSIVAKLVADITFYIPAIIGYEMSKKKMRNF
ncbi:MAG: hypothetical protein EOP56_16125 [Sphingobacteriales bacterium]|nr:MAG: hypothetical protein EOP56_16125 [Sphingobacteriales bacterium]